MSNNFSSQTSKTSPGLSTPFAVVILVGITAIIGVGLYWLYLVTIDEQKVLAQEESYRPITVQLPKSNSYVDQEAYFNFTLPEDWMVKESYYYETAAQEKATVPTVIFGQEGVGDTNLNRISINLRQSSCMAGDNSTEKTENLGGITVKTIDYANNQWCSEAQVKGLDINQKNANYLFVSYYDDLGVEKVFNEIIQSFAVVSSENIAMPIILGAVENNFTELETIQGSVDNGSGPWRLDPLAVATADGVALGFDQENDDFTLVSKVDIGEYSGTGEAIVEAVHGGVTYEIQLIQPIKQGATGIWAINSVNKK